MKIVAIQKDKNGNIIQYKLDNNSIIGIEQAVHMVENKEIQNCNVFTTRKGYKAIRSNNDGDTSQNLDNLPTF